MSWKDGTTIYLRRNVVIVFLFGIASGLPLPLVAGTLLGWMTDVGVDIKTVGLFSSVMLPYTLKFLWAPFFDRFTLPFLNRRTGWLVVVQGLLILSIFALGQIDPKTQIELLAIGAILVSFFGASQDILIDAYRAEILAKDELGPGAAAAATSGRLAYLFSGGLAFILADQMAWSEVYALMSVVMAIGLVTSFFAPAPVYERKSPTTIREAVVDPLVGFLAKPKALLILLFIVLFKVGDVVAGQMFTPFLIKIGYGKTEIGTLNKILGTTFTIVGSVVSGFAVTRLGIWRSLIVFGALQPLSNLIFVVLASVPISYPLLALSVGVENITTGLGSTAFIAFLMALCDKRFSATQYALLSSMTQVARPIIGSSSGYLAEYLGWPGFFLSTVILGLPGYLLIFAFKKDYSENAQS